MIWFIVSAGPLRTVIYGYDDLSADFVEHKKKLFRAEGTPVLAVVRLKLFKRSYHGRTRLEEHSASDVIRHM